jgi:CHASE3 domain sensor protein
MPRANPAAPHPEKPRRETALYLSCTGALLALSLLGFLSLRALVAEKDALLDTEAQALIEAQALRADSEHLMRKSRSFLLLGDSRLLAEMRRARKEFSETSDHLRELVARPEGRRVLARIDKAYTALSRLTEDAIARRQSGAALATLVPFLEEELQPAADDLTAALTALLKHKERLLKEAKRDSSRETARTMIALGFFGLAAFLVAAGSGLFLLRANALIRHKNRDLDAFAGRASHDLRNLLAPLSLSADLLARQPESPGRIKSTAGALARAVRQSLAALDGLLAFSRAGQPPEPGARADVAAVAAAAAETLRPQA